MRFILTAVVALGLAAGITAPKLYKMCQIKGVVPGARSHAEVVSQKWHQTPAEHYRGRNVYWISWGTTPIRQKGDHRTNLEPE